MIWTVPNILTIGRILAAPCLALCFVVFDRPTADWVAFFLFVIAAVTDFFDGWLARRLGQITEVGKMLDPIADKAMVIMAFVVLMAMAPLPDPNIWQDFWDLRVWAIVPIAIIVLREVSISGLREFLGDVKLPVTRLAKWKTAVQMIAIGVLLIGAAAREQVRFDAYDRSGAVVDVYDGSLVLIGLAEWLTVGGLALLWLAAILTLVTGWDYFRKGLAYIQAQEES